MQDSKMTPIETEKPIKTSLFSALSDLQNIISTIQDLAEETESEDELNALIAQHLPVINEQKIAIKEKVDARINFIEHIDMLAKKTKEDEEYLAKRRKGLENLKKRLMAQTKSLMEENPEIPFKGTRKEFKIQKNGGKQSISYQTAFKSLDYIIDDQAAKFLEDEFKEKKEVWVLKKPEFDEAIRKGLQHPYAILEEKGTHIRIR